MHLIVPAIPFGLHLGIDFGGHDQQAIGQSAHSAFLLHETLRKDGMPTNDNPQEGMVMRILMGLAAATADAVAGGAQAQETPRKAGSIRTNAPAAPSI